MVKVSLYVIINYLRKFSKMFIPLTPTIGVLKGRALLLFQGRLINEQKIPFERHSIFRSRQNFVLPRSFISNSLFKQFVVVVNSSKVNMCLAVSLFLKKKKKLSNILHESICYFVA